MPRTIWLIRTYIRITFKVRYHLIYVFRTLHYTLELLMLCINLHLVQTAYYFFNLLIYRLISTNIHPRIHYPRRFVYIQFAGL
jgi:hypothetical protein